MICPSAAQVENPERQGRTSRMEFLCRDFSWKQVKTSLHVSASYLSGALSRAFVVHLLPHISRRVDHATSSIGLVTSVDVCEAIRAELENKGLKMRSWMPFLCFSFTLQSKPTATRVFGEVQWHPEKGRWEVNVENEDPPAWAYPTLELCETQATEVPSVLKATSWTQPPLEEPYSAKSSPNGRRLPHSFA